jgi:fluoride exporter
VTLKLLIIGLGGAIGSIGRYILQGFFQSLLGGAFPFGTFIVNVLGCFIIGFFVEFSFEKLFISVSLKNFIIIGILGGFTTFSAFGYETFTLLREQEIFLAMVNVLSSIFFSILAVWCGSLIGKFL